MFLLLLHSIKTLFVHSEQATMFTIWPTVAHPSGS